MLTGARAGGLVEAAALITDKSRLAAWAAACTAAVTAVLKLAAPPAPGEGRGPSRS